MCAAPIRHTGAVCGLLAYLTDPSADVVRRSGRRGVGRLPSDASPRSRRAGHLVDDDDGGARLQPAVDHRHRAQPSAAALGPGRDAGPLRAGLQRRDLQLPGTARGAGGRPRRAVRHRRRRRGDHRRLPPLGRRRADPAARHVRVRAVGHRRARVVLRARPVRHQAAVHGDRPRRHRRRQREEVPAGPAPASWASTSASTNAPCSTTRCCSTCRNPRRCTAACGGWSRAATPASGPGQRRR